MLELSASLRQKIGRQNKHIREKGLIPAILYGHRVKNLPLAVKAKDFEKVYQEAGESSLIKLKIKDDQEKETKSTEGKPASLRKERMVLIQEVAKDPVSDKIIHIDFHQVKMDEAIKAEVPLVFIGSSLAVERENGVLVKNLQHLEVEALPQDLPHEIQVDISSLKTFDDNIRVKDVAVPEKVKVMAEPEEMIASVVPPRAKEELAELEEAPKEEVEKVEVEAEKKVKEVREAAKETETPAGSKKEE